MREPADSRDVPADQTAVVDIEHVAAAFDPHSDAAWRWAFPDPAERGMWINGTVLDGERRWPAGATEARTWADHGFNAAGARPFITNDSTVPLADALTIRTWIQGHTEPTHAYLHLGDLLRSGWAGEAIAGHIRSTGAAPDTETPQP